MKPASFEYRAPEQLDELLELLADDFTDVRVIAGGQSLVPMMNFRLSTPELLLDLRRVDELGALEHRPDGALSVGATVTQARLLRQLEQQGGWPVLAEGIRHIGHPQIRSRGTVCGSLAHHDPTAELPALAVALDARMTVAGPQGRRTVAAADFFTTYYETVLEPGELLAEVVFPAWPAARGWGFRELARRRGDFALVGAVATVDRDAAGATAEAVALVLFGVGERPVRLGGVEQALAGKPLDAAALASVEPLVAEAIDPVDDLHASADYRREIAVQLSVGALADAWERSSARV
ncbi:FAD binding domain-containing protein [Conexibacter arvalis]|uniref:Carbon-monoxide dehydrogenase medium subunit n=1 Tax=Conexibacter arvalis TaxID=912552 RepID=A0A840ICZ4_9ACTN|nr:FAD binding domain-containing protein [Conexibacter arvalis]MBB4661810.1 carbon-monoxide dehydrogenase medium subunit [Conexibacter arvalis]